ncbi:MAG: hypothetical protein ACYTF1_18280 [Planctomycetota bacterium]|jgi:hypothetical protein
MGSFRFVLTAKSRRSQRKNAKEMALFGNCVEPLPPLVESSRSGDQWINGFVSFWGLNRQDAEDAKGMALFGRRLRRRELIVERR